MKKTLISMTAILLAAAAIWTGRQQATVIVATDPAATSDSPPIAAATGNLPATQPSSPAIARQNLSLSASGRYSTDHQHTDEPVMPAAIERALEAERVPMSALVAQPHPHGGHLINLKGQYRTVTVAVTDENGQVHLIERRITPIPDAQSSVPVPAAAAAGNTAH